MLETKRTTNGNGDLTHLDFLGVAKSSWRKVRRIDPDYGKVRIRVVPDQNSFNLSGIGQGHFKTHCVVDDVAVGQDEAVRCNNKPRTCSPTFANLATIRVTMPRLDVHNAWADSLHHAYDRA